MATVTDEQNLNPQTEGDNIGRHKLNSNKQWAMDTREDIFDQRDICVLKCPFCESNFVIPIVYQTHLSAHISFHSEENIFNCKLCPEDHFDLLEIVLHVEKVHSEKRRPAPGSVLVRNVERQNLEERYRMISQLGACDDQTF